MARFLTRHSPYQAVGNSRPIGQRTVWLQNYTSVRRFCTVFGGAWVALGYLAALCFTVVGERLAAGCFENSISPRFYLAESMKRLENVSRRTSPHLAVEAGEVFRAGFASATVWDMYLCGDVGVYKVAEIISPIYLAESRRSRRRISYLAAAGVERRLSNPPASAS